MPVLTPSPLIGRRDAICSPRRLLPLALALALALSTSAGAQSGAGAELGRRLTEAAEQGVIPGAAVVVVHRGRIVFEQAVGYANIETKKPLKLSHYFYIGSAKEPIAATLILGLLDNRLMTLDEPATRWIRGLAGQRTGKGSTPKPPTLRQFLSHSGGLRSTANEIGGSWPIEFESRDSIGEAVEQILQVPYAYAPGQGFATSDWSNVMARYIVAAGLRFDTYRLHDDAFVERLRLADRTTSDARQRQAASHEKTAEGWKLAARQPPEPVSSVLLGAHHFRPRELARFMVLCLNDGEIGGSRLVPRERMIEARRNQVGEFIRGDPVYGSSEGYGLGWALEELDRDGQANVFHHHGGEVGVILWGDVRADLGVVLLAQAPRTQVTEFWMNEILPLILRAWGK